MDFRLFFRHMDSSLAVYAYAERKFGTLADKFGGRVRGVHLTVEAKSPGFEASALARSPRRRPIR